MGADNDILTVLLEGCALPNDSEMPDHALPWGVTCGDLRKAAAEIVRLRGEVSRWKTLAEDALAMRETAIEVDALVAEIDAIAPAEAKGDWFGDVLASMGEVVPLTLQTAEAKGVCSCPEHGSWIAADDILRNVRELDVALNGDEGAAQQAMLCDIVAQAKRHARLHGPVFTPQPADGGAVAWLRQISVALREVPIEGHDEKWFAAQDALAGLRTLLTHPPGAQVQPFTLSARNSTCHYGEHRAGDMGAAQVQQEAAIYGMFRALVDAGGAMTVARHGAMPRPEALAEALQRGMLAIERMFHPERFDDAPATHPAGDALGAVTDEMVERALRAYYEDGQIVCENPALKKDMRAAITAALQHRGDSQEVGRG